MKKILFPFEINNPQYKEAYVYAVKFARNLNAELIMFNAFKLDIDDNITEERYKKLIKENWVKAYSEVSKYNKYYLENYARVGKGLQIKFDYRFVHGKFLIELREILKEEIIDLVVLPGSDKKEFNKKQQEIIKDDIFAKTRTALLIVPFKGVFNPIKNIVFATNLKKLHTHQLYLNDVLEYAKIVNSNIHFLHISPKENAALPKDSDVYNTIMQIIKLNKNHVFKNILGRDVVESIERYIQLNKADLLILIKHERFFLDTMLYKSVSGELFQRSKIPVLIIREKDE